MSIVKCLFLCFQVWGFQRNHHLNGKMLKKLHLQEKCVKYGRKNAKRQGNLGAINEFIFIATHVGTIAWNHICNCSYIFILNIIQNVSIDIQ